MIPLHRLHIFNAPLSGQTVPYNELSRKLNATLLIKNPFFS